MAGGDDLSDAFLNVLRDDAMFSSLVDHFLRVGRGRRPALPSITGPTNKILLQLYCVKEEGKASWDEMTTWFNSLFPNVAVTRGRLEHKTKSLLSNGQDSAILSQPVVFYVVPEPLQSLGLSREALLLEKGEFTGGQITIHFKLLAALESFRSSEKLPQAFVLRWVSKLCPGYTDNQVRHKVSLALKKLADAKKRKATLEAFLEDVAIPPYSDQPREILDRQKDETAKQLLNTCQCTVLQKKTRLLEERLQAAEEKAKNFKLQVDILKEERDELKKLENPAGELIGCKKQLSVLNEKIEMLHQSKLYKSNAKLKKDVSRQRDLLGEKRRQLQENKEKLKYLETTNMKLNLKLRSEQTLKSRYKSQKEEQKKLADSLQYLLQIDEDEAKIKLKESGNKFSPNVRLAIMRLQGEARVSARNCGSAIEIVASCIFGTSLKSGDLPCTSTSLNIADEAHHVAKFQIGDEIKNCSSFTFASDGTSRQKQHFMERHIQLKSGKVLSMGFQKIASDTANNLLEQTLEALTEISNIYAEEANEDKEEIFRDVLSKMQCLMSDRAANMKLFNQKLASFKENVLQGDSPTHFLYCNAHFLLGVASATEEALKEEAKKLSPLGRDKESEFDRFRSSNETAALRLIRTAADIFGPRGDEKSGCRQDWLMYCETQNTKSRFSSHRSNRFNNIFENASAVIFHRDHVRDFLKNYSPICNLKTKSVCKDVEDNQLLSIVAAMAKFNQLFTSPYWKLMNSHTPYGSFPPFVKSMQESLIMWKSSGPGELPPIFSPFSSPDSDTENFLRTDRCNTIIFMEVFKSISSNCCAVLERQLADFLDGGVFSSLTKEMKDLLDTCPLTNLTGERLFGDLDFDLQKRRRASVHHRTTINMWKHNKTNQWLSKKTKKEKERILMSAKKKGFALRALHKEAEERVKEQVKEKLEEVKTKREESFIKDNQLRSTILNDMIAAGGFCDSKPELDRLYATGKLEDLKAQVRYRKHFLGEKDLKLSGSKKELYSRLLEKILASMTSESETESESDR